MPGMGMCAPMRYTASNASVNKTRFRKSSMRNMFFTASMNLFMLFCKLPLFNNQTLRHSGGSQDLERGARGSDLFFRRGAKSVRVNGDLRRKFAITEDLD